MSYAVLMCLQHRIFIMWYYCFSIIYLLLLKCETHLGIIQTFIKRLVYSYKLYMPEDESRAMSNNTRNCHA